MSPVIAAAIDGGHTTRAGRVAGALRSIGREEQADALLSTMRQVGHVVLEENPFEENLRLDVLETSPYASRIRLMWMAMRPVVLSVLDTSQIRSRQQDVDSILALMDATYVKDSYNSLSIEGYKITEGLLERVRSGNWDPKNDEQDKDRKNALREGIIKLTNCSETPLHLFLPGKPRRWFMQKSIRHGISSCSSLV